jgi:hypothetical protein
MSLRPSPACARPVQDDENHVNSHCELSAIVPAVASVLARAHKTPTQAIVPCTAPTEEACRVEASESSGFSALRRNPTRYVFDGRPGGRRFSVDCAG